MVEPNNIIVSFDDYSRKYDLLLKHSPPYQAIGQKIVATLQQDFSSEDMFSVLDIGGGIGNFSKYIQDAFPKANITLLEPNDKMRAIAANKLDATRSNFLDTPFQNYESQEKFEVVICIHALYLMPESRQLIPKFKANMHANSRLIICDIGQEIKVKDWTIYLLKENFKQHGLWPTLKLFRLSAEIKSANREIQSKQQEGDLWQHDLTTFKAWFSTIYDVLAAHTCYRGCSNFLVCKPLNHD